MDMTSTGNAQNLYPLATGDAKGTLTVASGLASRTPHPVPRTQRHAII